MHLNLAMFIAARDPCRGLSKKQIVNSFSISCPQNNFFKDWKHDNHYKTNYMLEDLINQNYNLKKKKKKKKGSSQSTQQCLLDEQT